jgi:hypothetical protein
VPESPPRSLLALADELITGTRNRHVDDLRREALLRPVTDPALRAAMHIRQELDWLEPSITNAAAALHRRFRPDQGVLEVNEAEYLVHRFAALSSATAKAHTHLEAVGRICAAVAASKADTVPELVRTQAATVRSAPAHTGGTDSVPASPAPPARPSAPGRSH